MRSELLPSPPTRLAPTVMVQGTASGVGKSALVAALCRLLRREGLRVAPFKAQNMSNNAAVCPAGGEIGRAQAAQAEAAGVEPTVDMNPILLKPEGDSRSQVVVRGRVWRRLSAREYHATRTELLDVVADSLNRLRACHDVVVIEGAGSPAEVNLRDSDLVNMPVARLADSPVLLVADIDRGGALAALVGTLALLEAEDASRVCGLLVNRFRGDRALLQPGLDFLEARTGRPVLGVVPFLHDLRLPSEDSQDLDRRPADRGLAPARDAAARGVTGLSTNTTLDVAVVRLPRIANFDDFSPLEAEPGVVVRYVGAPAEFGVPDLVILPGTKSTLADLAWLRRGGLGTALLRLAAAGTPVLGICGGYQMLGTEVADPDGVEGEPATAVGLGLLDVATRFESDKATRQVRGQVVAHGGFFGCLGGQALAGYEIHLGQTTGAATPFARLATNPAAALAERNRTAALTASASAGGQSQRQGPVLVSPSPNGERDGIVQDSSAGRSGSSPDGAVAPDGLVAGTYVHGLFHTEPLRRALLAGLARRRGLTPDRASSPAVDPYDRLADAVAANVDLARLYALCRLPVKEST
jgi:adenosylcobyric acid synthase